MPGHVSKHVLCACSHSWHICGKAADRQANFHGCFLGLLNKFEQKIIFETTFSKPDKASLKWHPPYSSEDLGSCLGSSLDTGNQAPRDSSLGP